MTALRIGTSSWRGVCVHILRAKLSAGYALLLGLLMIPWDGFAEGVRVMASKKSTKQASGASGGTPSDSTTVEPGEYLADVSTKLISGVLGLMGFMVASFVGVMASNPGLVILSRAILAMIVCAFVGRALGAVGEVCVRQFVLRYKADRPVPEKPRALVELEQSQQSHDELMKKIKKAV